MCAPKKIISFLVLVFFVASLVFYPSPHPVRAAGLLSGAADCASSIFGLDTPDLGDVVGSIGKVPVEAKSTTKSIKQKSCKDFLDRLADIAYRTALANLKKRILDSVVDQTISWINGNGSPQFVTNIGGLLEDSAQAAVGDTLQDLGLGRVCQPFSNALRQNIALKTALPFSERVSCTLDQVVGNFQDFYTNFHSGGWIAYYESLKPQNNYDGALILAEAEADARKAKAEKERELELVAGQGFLNTKECLEWTLYGETYSGSSKEIEVIGVDKKNFNYPDPSNPPGENEINIGDVEPGIANFNWKCTQVTDTTPGSVKKDAVGKALSAHTDYIIQSDDLEDYAAAIIDAGINRLIKEGVSGLRNVITGGSNGYSSESDFPGVLRGAGNDYLLSQNEQEVGSSRDQMLENLKEADQTLDAAKTQLTTALGLLPSRNTAYQNFRSWCDSPYTVGPITIGINKDHYPETCAIYSSSTVDGLAAQTASETAEINALLQEIDPLLQRVSVVLPKIQNLTNSNAATVTREASNVIKDMNRLVDGAAQFLASIQNEIKQAQSTLRTCQNPSLASYSCP